MIQRSFEVEIQANSQGDASKLVETFLGYRDDSNGYEREKNNFQIHSIDLLDNKVIEISNFSGN